MGASEQRQLSSFSTQSPGRTSSSVCVQHFATKTKMSRASSALLQGQTEQRSGLRTGFLLARCVPLTWLLPSLTSAVEHWKAVCSPVTCLSPPEPPE